MKRRIDAVLMASGFSERFGAQDKLVSCFRGKALARHTLELVCRASAFFGELFFVAASEAVRELVRGLPVRVIWNEHPERGQAESIRLGVNASGAEYYGFFPCDQPLLDAETVGRLAAACRPGCIVEPAFQGIPGTPTFFSCTFRAELLGLQPGESGRVIKRRHPEAVITVPLSRPEPLFDVDTPEMLEALA